MGLADEAARVHLVFRAFGTDGRGDALLVEVGGFGEVVGVEEVLGESLVGILDCARGIFTRVHVPSQRGFCGDERILDEGHLVHGHLLELLVVVGVDEPRLHLVLGEVIVPDAVPGGGEVVEVDERVGTTRDEGVEGEGLLEVVVSGLQCAGFGD